MKGSETKLIKYMEGADKRLSFRFIRETMTGRLRTVSSFTMTL